MRSVATPNTARLGQSVNRDSSPLDRHTHEPPIRPIDHRPFRRLLPAGKPASRGATLRARARMGHRHSTSPTPPSVSTPSSCATAIPPGNACLAGNCWLSGCTVLLTLWTGPSANSSTPAWSASSTAGPDGGTSPTATTSPRTTRMGTAAGVAARSAPTPSATPLVDRDTQVGEGRGSSGSRTSAATPERLVAASAEGGRRTAARPREQDP